MHRILALTLALAIALPAAAQSVTFGSKVLSEGDSVARVYELAGQPTRVVRLENKFGAAMGERLEYYRDGKAILITISGGVVQSISVSYS
jgi:hypothetical protein